MADLYALPGQAGWSNYYLNYDPQAGYTDWMRQAGLGMGQGRGADPYKSFVSGLYGQYQKDYTAQSAYNPNLQWTDYMSKQNPMKEWQGMSPGQRSENPGAYSPRLRWVV